MIGVDFKQIENSSTDTVLLTAMGTVEPPVHFLPPDTAVAVTRVNLPLNYFADETTFFFQNGETVDLLRLNYVSQAQFVSENCGEKFVLSKLRVVEHSFDSVRLVRDVPNSSGGVIHIEIFQ